MNKTTLTLQELTQYLHELLDCNALELVMDSDTSTSNLYIPYMMNDALENYIILENCQITGAFSKTIPANTTFEIVDRHSASEKHAIIFHKENGEILTIWFSTCFQKIEYFQYHRIGHFWVAGQEHWRRLVYIIGTIHEKYTFLGGASCNDQELKLMQLMEFPPFRYWSPIHETLENYFPNSENGLFFMHQFALEAGDKSYARWIRLYRRLPFKFMCEFLAKKLTSPKRENLYQLINKKVTQASEEYGVRDYGEKRNAEIEELRRRFSEKLYSEGFVGEYPEFQKDAVRLLAMEEHPFTISELEYENFEFKIRGMMTEDRKHYLY